MHSVRGFTTIEIIALTIVILLVGAAALVQIQNIQSSERDNLRKTNINAIYHGLKIFYKKNSYYPEIVNSKTLPFISPEAFRDPSNLVINSRESDFRYAPSGCAEERCRSYTLRSTLEKEADYIKPSNPASR